MDVVFLNKAELEATLERLRQSPKDNGVLEMIVKRPGENEREVVQERQLDLDIGLVDDT